MGRHENKENTLKDFCQITVTLCKLALKKFEVVKLPFNLIVN
jgi:hypothetical protein